MSRRRRSGTALLDDAEELVQLQQTYFEDFRRKHSKQNKEVINDNINRARAVRAMQDQVNRLQHELLLVQEENRDLKRRMERMRKASSRARGEGAIEALDAVLQTVPALQALRDSLVSSLMPDAPSAQHEPYLHNFVNPTATRPAARAGHMMGLDMLCEAEHEPSPEPQRRKNVPSPNRLASPGGRRILFKSASGSSPANSPSPKRAQGQVQVRKHKKRRESGLLIPRPLPADEDSEDDADDEQPSPSRRTVELPEEREPAATAAAPAPTRRSSTLADSTTALAGSTSSQWEEGESVCVEPEDAAALLDEDVVEASITPKRERAEKAREKAAERGKVPEKEEKDKVAEKAVAPAEDKPRRSRSPQLSQQTQTQPADRPAPAPAPAPAAAAVPTIRVNTVPITKRVPVPLAPAALDSRSSATPTPTEEEPDTDAAAEPEPEEETGRTRRARGSVVSYKEPSLRKKMRKPDGATVDDILGVRNRGAAASADIVNGVRRKSALPRSTTTRVPIALDDEGAATAGSSSPSPPLSAGRTSQTASASSSLSTIASSSSTSAASASTLRPATERARRTSPTARAALADIDTASANSNANAGLSSASPSSATFSPTGIPAPTVRKTATSALSAAEKRRRATAV